MSILSEDVADGSLSGCRWKCSNKPALTSKLRMVPNMGLVAKKRDVWGCHNSVCGCRNQLGTTPPTPGSSIRTNYTRWSWNCCHFNVEIILNLSFAFVWADALYFQLLIVIPFYSHMFKIVLFFTFFLIQLLVFTVNPILHSCAVHNCVPNYV